MKNLYTYTLLRIWTLFSSGNNNIFIFLRVTFIIFTTYLIAKKHKVINHLVAFHQDVMSKASAILLLIT